MILVHFRFQVRESNFTRTISNPDFVVKKNRQMKHAKALAKTQSVELTIYTDLSPTCYFVKGEEIRLWISRVLERFSTEHKDQKCSELNSLQILVLCSVQIRVLFWNSQVEKVNRYYFLGTPSTNLGPLIRMSRSVFQ